MVRNGMFFYSCRLMMDGNLFLDMPQKNGSMISMLLGVIENKDDLSPAAMRRGFYLSQNI
jgi:hypothetical protein